jgi:uncharacterized membrane protein YcaP (DUF421 family)
MDLLRIAVRVLFAYVLLHQLLRHAGHRVVASGANGGSGGKGAGIEFMLALIMGDMVDDVLWAEVPAAQFVVACGALVVLHLLVTSLRHVNARWRWLIEGTPVPLLADGVPQPRGMRRERVNEAGLAALLRRAGLDRSAWTQVRSVLLEVGGTVSVLRHRWAKPVTAACRRQVRSMAE